MAMMEKTYGQLDNIQEMINSIETAKMNAEIFSALQEGKEALKTLNDLISISDVENLLEENADQMELAAELDRTVGQYMGKFSEQQEEEIEEEYQKLLELEALEMELLLPHSMRCNRIRKIRSK